MNSKTIEDELMNFITELGKLGESKVFQEAGNFGQGILYQALVKTTADRIRDKFKGEEAPQIE